MNKFIGVLLLLFFSVVVQAQDTKNVTVSWSHSGINVDGFEFYIADSNGAEKTIEAGAADRSFETGLATNATYTIQGRAFNRAGFDNTTQPVTFSVYPDRVDSGGAPDTPSHEEITPPSGITLTVECDGCNIKVRGTNVSGQ